MMRLKQLTALLGIWMAVAGTGHAFSLIGPFKTWHVYGLGYAQTYDIGGPMTLFEDYRWNVPDVYYAMDSSFLNYFGARGEREVDKAFDILNGLPEVSSLSTNLDEFPLTGVRRENYLAQTLGILDVRSIVLQLLVEEMGLADPVRYAWTLRSTNTIPNSTNTQYIVVRHNYDPVTYGVSSFINGSPWGYTVGPVAPPVGGGYFDAVEVPFDTVPEGDGDPSPVASGDLTVGQFWIGLSRDDVGGLRWLLRQGNYNTELLPTNSLVAVTNRSTQVLVTNQDLPTLVRNTTHTTNSVAGVLALYPNLRLTGSNTYYLPETQTNRYWVLTNDVSAPTGHVQLIVSVTTNQVLRLTDYTYDNVVTNLEYNSFYIIPPNVLEYQFVNTLLTNVVPITNLVYNPSNFFFLNTNLPVLLTNHDLALFALRTVDTTNDALTLQTYYPGLVITNTNTFYSILVATNHTAYFTNAPFGPRQLTTTNIVTNAIPRYNYAYANVFTNVLLSVPVWENGATRYYTTTNIAILPTNYVGYVLVSNLFFQTVTNVYTNTIPGHGWYINYDAPVAISSSNLALFSEQARTNSSTNLLAIYPDLVITNTAYTIGVQTLTNYFFYLTNPPFAPAGMYLPVYYPVVTNVLATNYTHRFANVITNTYFTSSPLYVAYEEVYRAPFAPAGSLITRTNWRQMQVGIITNGDIYVIPTNLVGYQLIATLLTNYAVMTNLLQPAFATNFAGTNVGGAGTNLVASTNVVYTNTWLLSYGTNYVFSAYPVQPDPGTNYIGIYTNHFTAIYGVEGVPGGTNSDVEIVKFTNVMASAIVVEFTNSTSQNLRPGIEKIRFHNITRNYDSMIGQFFTPYTNQYTEQIVTNSALRPQVVRRVLGSPDIIFVSEDNGLDASFAPVMARRSANFVNFDALNGVPSPQPQGGPGVISPQVRISLSDQVPYYINQTPFLLDNFWTVGGLVWGSFDGSTNTPAVYPDYISIQELEREVLQPPPGLP